MLLLLLLLGFSLSFIKKGRCGISINTVVVVALGYYAYRGELNLVV